MSLLQNQGWYDPSVPASAPGSGSWQNARVSKRGEQRVVDFLTEMLLEGRIYQIRAGTITTGLAATSGVSDTVADMCYDAATGLTILPVGFHIAVRDVATSLTFQVYIKGVGAVSTAGTAFVPLPLVQGGSGSSGTARVQAGNVTVAAELATTTRRIFEHQNALTEAPTTFNADMPLVGVQAAASQLRYVGTGPACMYIQISAATAAPLYMATFDVLELPSTAI